MNEPQNVEAAIERYCQMKFEGARTRIEIANRNLLAKVIDRVLDKNVILRSGAWNTLLSAQKH
jgi:hypothetical protein